ncbi:MAG: hypothetical protein A3B68_04075 [Candidatus Melainabacteria bacterium RIFCSPHIGHO2_02_FULL_34_12]|nr:MAG: hypothetical protein A3B68_04075 [Candidatus Melainabacteria bacterium RIFCSPHIGHO2_02_FULL_34_12]
MNSIMLKIYLTCLLISSLLFSNFYLIAFSDSDVIKDVVNKAVKEDKVVGGKTDNKISKESEDEAEAEAESKSKVDPTETYKIIAIYLIGNKPKTLIKNVTTPEDPPVEYAAGDYLDELQNFSVSKILFNPTARVEIIDVDGIAYLMKPNTADDKAASVKSKPTFGAKTVPSYFSGTNTNQKSKKDRRDESLKETTTQQNTPPPPPPAAVGSPAAKSPSSDTTKTPADSSVPSPQSQGAGTSQTLQTTGSTAQPPAQNSLPAAAAVTPAAKNSPSPASGDTTRPANPFGE